jgi:hypothetical protein
MKNKYLLDHPEEDPNNVKDVEYEAMSILKTKCNDFSGDN